MRVTIDSSESLEHVLPVISALYRVELTVAPKRATTQPRSGRDRKSGQKRSGKAAKRASRRPARADKADPATVREWARENGHSVAASGRISSDVLAAYSADSAR